jgi:hypothetical protein
MEPGISLWCSQDAAHATPCKPSICYAVQSCESFLTLLSRCDGGDRDAAVVSLHCWYSKCHQNWQANNMYTKDAQPSAFKEPHYWFVLSGPHWDPSDWLWEENTCTGWSKKSLCTSRLYCNHQVHRDFLITLYIITIHFYWYLWKSPNFCSSLSCVFPCIVG